MTGVSRSLATNPIDSSRAQAHKALACSDTGREGGARTRDPGIMSQPTAALGGWTPSSLVCNGGASVGGHADLSRPILSGVVATVLAAGRSVGAASNHRRMTTLHIRIFTPSALSLFTEEPVPA